MTVSVYHYVYSCAPKIHRLWSAFTQNQYPLFISPLVILSHLKLFMRIIWCKRRCPAKLLNNLVKLYMKWPKRIWGKTCISVIVLFCKKKKKEKINCMSSFAQKLCMWHQHKFSIIQKYSWPAGCSPNIGLKMVRNSATINVIIIQFYYILIPGKYDETMPAHQRQPPDFNVYSIFLNMPFKEDNIDIIIKWPKL